MASRRAESAGIGEGVVIRSRKAGRAAARAEKQIAKAAVADRKATVKEAEIRAKERAERDEKADGISGFTVKRYVGIARIVVPIVAPLAYQAAGTLRARYDEYQARRLGVAPDELADFSGRGAALYARIHNIALSVRDLRTRRTPPGQGEPAEVRSFAEETENRLTDLEAAVRAAEQMPTPRRRRAHVAASAELDRVESAVLARLGLEDGAGPAVTRG